MLVSYICKDEEQVLSSRLVPSVIKQAGLKSYTCNKNEKVLIQIRVISFKIMIIIISYNTHESFNGFILLKKIMHLV